MSFPLIGNEKVKTTVESFLALDKLPHAILITGDAGTGRHTLADYISKAAVCTGEVVPCGKCHGCRMADALSHPDIIRVKKESGKKELGVGIIRDMRADAFIKSHEAERKLYIIDEADSMNKSAQNALLKILEEPPEGVHFILIAKQKAAMLPTVLSRCTLLSLFAPPAEEGIELLSRLAGCDGDTARQTLDKTHGNIGAAAGLLNKSLKSIAADAASEFMKLIFSGDGYGMLKVLSPFEKDRAAAEEVFSELKIRISEEITRLPKNGKRAQILFELYKNTEKYNRYLKSYTNLPLLFCEVVADINENRG